MCFPMDAAKLITFRIQWPQCGYSTLSHNSCLFILWCYTGSIANFQVFSLALTILTINLMRHILHGLPYTTSTLSVFLDLKFPLGPTAQSGFAILLIGQDTNKLLPFPSIPVCPFEILPPQRRLRLLLIHLLYLSIFPPIVATIFHALLATSALYPGLRRLRSPFVGITLSKRGTIYTTFFKFY